MTRDSVLSGVRILVVEDETIVAWALADNLAEIGCTVVGPAASVRQALAIVATETVDAAILDVNLDGENSYPIADVLLARGVPFVLSTGYSRSSLSLNYRDLPMLQKPYGLLELRGALAELLAGGPAVPPG